MKNFMMKKADELNVGETFGFLVIYMMLYLAFVWVIMEFETIADKIKAFCQKIKNFFKKIKVKLVG